MVSFIHNESEIEIGWGIASKPKSKIQTTFLRFGSQAADH